MKLGELNRCTNTKKKIMVGLHDKIRKRVALDGFNSDESLLKSSISLTVRFDVI